LTRILVIDDDESSRTLAREALTRAGFEVLVAADGAAGMRLMAEVSVDVVVTDIYMPGQDGVMTIRRLRRSHPTLPIVAMSGGSSAGDMLEAALALGASVALDKPFVPSEIVNAVRHVLRLASP
jgi:DNA-binding response OmpR family regulator